jgi:hypothetical protein
MTRASLGDRLRGFLPTDRAVSGRASEENRLDDGISANRIMRYLQKLKHSQTRSAAVLCVGHHVGMSGHDQDGTIARAALLLHRSSSFEQKPGALLGLVDPIFQEAFCRDIVMLLAEAMRLAHVGNQLLVVVT